MVAVTQFSSITLSKLHSVDYAQRSRKVNVILPKTNSLIKNETFAIHSLNGCCYEVNSIDSIVKNDENGLTGTQQDEKGNYSSINGANVNNMT